MGYFKLEVIGGILNKFIESMNVLNLWDKFKEEGIHLSSENFSRFLYQLRKQGLIKGTVFKSNYIYSEDEINTIKKDD